MASVWTDQKWFEENNSDMLRTMAGYFGFEESDWKIAYNVKIKGKSQTIHTFDVALESTRDHTIIPVLYLKELEDSKSEKIMLHRVKSTDISAATGYVVTDYEIDTKEKALCEICNLKIIRMGTRPTAAAEYMSSPGISNYSLSISRDDTFSNIRSRKAPVKKRNRDRTKITQEILENVLYLEGASITQLIYKCNLNYKSAKTILQELMNKELVKAVDYKESGKRYELTERGKKALERLRIYEAV